MRLGRKMRVLTLVPLVLSIGCVGRVHEPGSEQGIPDGKTPNGGEGIAADARVRRLSATEIARSIEDVFLGGQPINGPPGPTVVARGSFDNQIANLTVDTDVPTHVLDRIAADIEAKQLRAFSLPM